MATIEHKLLSGTELHDPKSHTHDTLYLKRGANDFSSVGAEKASPGDTDRVLIEDSAAGLVKKYAQLGNLPGGGGSATWAGLTDTVAAIVANQLVIGNGAGTQLGFVNPSTLDVGKVDGCDAGVATANVFKIPASLTRGDIFFVNVSGNVVRLGAGTSGHFLKTQSTAADPIWAPVPGGGALGDLSDVTITAATSGDTIVHDGSVFVNANIDTRIMATKLDDFATPNDNIDLNASTVQHGLLPKLGGGTVNFLRADGSWAAPPGAAGGETNTASNQGIGGVGVYYQKVGVDLQFKNINAGSNQISITDDTGNHEIDIDVVESNIKLDDLGTPDDTIDLNASTLRHGLLSKLGGGTVNFLRADGTWSEPPGAAGGEANTGSNVGTAGVGVFKQKTGADLEFKKINAGSSNITITDDVANNEVDIDVSTNVFLADGTVPMAGGLDLGSHSTTNVFSLKAADASGIEIRDSVNNVIAYFGYPTGKTLFSGDLGMGANSILNVQSIAGPTAGGNMLALTGDSDTYNSRIYLYSNTFGGLSQYEGQIKFDMVNAALTGMNTAVEIDGKTDSPLLHVYYGLDMNSKKIESLLAGSAAADAVRYDQVVLIPASSAQGDILYRDAAGWTRLAAGTSGRFLKTQGASANPVWAKKIDYFSDDAFSYGNLDVGPVAEFYDNKTYIVWSAANNHPYICTYDHNTKTYSAPVRVGTNPKLTDYHPSPCVIRDAAGYWHVFHGSHNSALKHEKSDAIDDISTWTSQTDIGSVTTYPRVVMVGTALYLVYRASATGRPEIYRTSTDNGATWSAENAIIQFSASDWIYGSCLAVDTTNARIHIAWSYYPGSGNYLNVYHAYLNTTDHHMYAMNGTDLGTTIDKTEADAHCLVTTHTNTYIHNVGVPPSGNPHVAYRDKTAGTVCHRYWTGSVWTAEETVTPMHDNGILVVHSDDNIDMHMDHGGPEIWNWNGSVWRLDEQIPMTGGYARTGYVANYHTDISAIIQIFEQNVGAHGRRGMVQSVE